MSNDSSNEPGNAAAGLAFQVGDRVKALVNPQHEHGVVIEPDEPGLVLIEMAADSIAPGAHLHYRPEQLTLISRATPAPAPAQTAPRHTAECEAAWAREQAHNRAWPQHCPSCAGYGQIQLGGSWDEPDWVDPCPDCTKKGICPRCGKQNTLASEGGDGPCSACGWDYNGDDPFCDDRGGACICPEPDYDAPEPDYDAPEPAASEPATPAPAATAGALDTHTLVIESEAREWCQQCDNTGYVTYADGSTDPCRECDATGYVWQPRTIRLSDEAVDRLAAALAKRMAGDIRMIANDRP